MSDEFKYKMIKAGRMPVHRTSGTRIFYQIRALRDIPEHNVKAGDLGGYVSHPDNLSQFGSCWVGEKAQVVGKHVRILNDAYIGGNAVLESLTNYLIGEHSKLVISGSARVTEDATVVAKAYFKYCPKQCAVTDEAQIYGEAFLDTVLEVNGASKIYGSADIDKAKLISNSEIYDRVTMQQGTVVYKSSLYGDTIVGRDCAIESSAIYGSAVIYNNASITPGTVIEGTKTLFESYQPVEKNRYGKIFSVDLLGYKEIGSEGSEAVPAVEATPASQTKQGDSAIVRAYREVIANIESYRNDVVKLIKYPVMTDQTDDHTLNMMMALKSVQRLEDDPASVEFKEAVVALEKAFMKAESNARKIASTLLSDADRKKTEKAKDLFKIASNESSSEQEKKVAFVQGFKQLEGVLDIPEVAVDTFRVKIGLPELEM